MHWIDAEGLPEVTGTIERFVVNAHGEVDGFVMTGEKQDHILVHTPPHMEGELIRHVKGGDRIGVRGVRPRGADLLVAIAVTAKNGRQVIDEGPDHDRKHPEAPHRKMDAEGKVRLSLFGPKGELRGALLIDGTVVRIGHKEAELVATLLKPGATIAVRGDGLETDHGRVIDAKEVGSGMDDLRPVKRPKQKPMPKRKHDPAAHA
jgi:hypothetical protein